MIQGLLKKLKGNDVPIKKRLDIACVLLIFITITTTLLCCLGCVSVSVAWTRRTQTLSVMNNDDVLLTCREITHQITEAISESEKSNDMKKFTDMEKRLSGDSTYVMIFENGKHYHSFGSADAADSMLKKASDEIGESGYISSGNRQLYMRNINVDGKTYTAYIFISKVNEPYREIFMILIVVICAAALVFALAFLFARKFLSVYVFSKILQPLETLENGVCEIQNGNLGYSIDYSGTDEFSSICSSFNTMSTQLKMTSDKLKHQEQNRKMLLASISHDLRTPLTTISAYAGGLLDGIAESKDAQERYLQQIIEKSSEMTRMVNRLFMFSKMDMDEYPIYPVPLSLGEEIQSFVEAIRYEYEEKGLNIIITQNETCPVNVDIKQLHTAFSNIIENSLRYKQGAIGHLTIAVYEEDENSVISFRDDGPGVADEDLVRLFDVFYRSDISRKNSGTGSGIGLAIVANAVKRSNGTVTASNILPHGLEIKISLPKGVDHEESTDN